MARFYKFLSLFASGASALAASVGPNNGWHFVKTGNSGIVALEVIVVSPTLAIFFDRATNDPLQVGNHTAWGALWNLKTNTATPLALVTDSFCASGGFLSNGTMISVGGNSPAIPIAQDGRQSIRIFEPCTDVNGVGCTVIEDPATLHLAEKRWYVSSARIFDGSLMIVGGTHKVATFYNIDPANTFEFFPPKDGGVPRPSAFLERSLPVNLFPRVFALPDGTMLMIASNQTIIYDIEKNAETILPDIPNGVRVTNPFDGTATLLPLSPPLYTPEVLVCGGTTSAVTVNSTQLSSQDPATDQCSRLEVTPEGIKRGWQVERMSDPRMMPDMVLLPNGGVLITNGGRTGYAAVAAVRDPVGNSSDADHPVFTPELYTPQAPLGRRLSQAGMPTTSIARMYHSGVSLTPQGNILITGSNPNNFFVNGTEFHSELRIETLNPPFMTMERPVITKAPSNILFNQVVTLSMDIPKSLNADNIQVALMDLGFSSHAFHSSQRLVFMTAILSPDRKLLTVHTPPNNRIYPPGPGWIFVTIDGVTSEAAHVLVGNGLPPPVADQGVPI